MKKSLKDKFELRLAVVEVNFSSTGKPANQAVKKEELPKPGLLETVNLKKQESERLKEELVDGQALSGNNNTFHSHRF